MLFTKKYAPKKLDEILGNDEAKERIKQWILNWIRNKKQKPLLVHGPPGIGKSALAQALKEEFDLEMIELNASDLRDKEHVERVMKNAMFSYSLFQRTKLFFIDDVDALQKSDTGGVTAIAKLVSESNAPIIITATDIWEKKLVGIRNACELIQFKRVSKPSILKLLKKIAEKESLHVDEELLIQIIENANGDVRSAINDLQAQITGTRDREKDIFERLLKVFKSTTYLDAKKAVEGNVDYNLLKLWIDENLPHEYEIKEDIANAYNWLSRADIFERRIRNSYWLYLRYVLDFMSAGVAIAKKTPYHKFTKYQFPKYLRVMAQTAERRAMLKAVGRKIGAKTYDSWKFSISYLSILKRIAKENPNRVVDFYGFEEEEFAFILNND